MAINTNSNYKTEYTRYRYYYHRLWIFYQKPAVQVSTALLLTIFAIIFFAAFAIRPTLITVADLIKRIQDRQAVLVQLEQKSAQLSAAQQEFLSLQSQLSVLDDALPQKPNPQQLITYIESTAATDTVTLNQLNVGAVTFTAAALPYTEGLQTLPVQLSVTGDFDNLIVFLTHLGNLLRQVTLTQVSLAPGDTTALTLNISGEALFYPN